MPTIDDKSNVAVQIEEAKQEFEVRLDEIFHQHLDEVGEPLVIDLAGDKDVVREKHAELVDEVEALVEAFERKAVIKRAEVHVQEITVVDSDGDGRLAINVMYDHRAY